MAKRNVPGVWTWGFYDGWVPNYLFWIAITHNSFGRFYEVQSYGPDVNPNLTLPATTTSREWFRPNPPYKIVEWSMRDNTNYMETGLLSSLQMTSQFPQQILENFYRKSANSIAAGRSEAPYAFIIPGDQADMTKAALLILNIFAAGLIAAAGVFAILKVALSGGAY